MRRQFRFALFPILSFLAAVSASPLARAQAGLGAQTRRLITQQIDEGTLVTLRGNTRPEANAANDRGPVAGDFPLEHMQIQLQLPAEKEQQLEQLNRELVDPASPNYHKWLTPDQFREQFSAAQEDVDVISSWLQSRGFTINVVYPRSIDFSGTAGQVRNAFRAEIHNLEVNGVRHIANMSDQQIPAALAPAVVGVISMNDFKPHPLYRQRANYTVGGAKYLVTPADLATIYNFNPVFAKGTTGQGQTIVVIEDTDVYNYPGDWNTFRSVLGLSGYTSGSFTQVHPAPKTGSNNCKDPGTNGDDIEAILDAEWASAGAPSATIELASCPSSYFSFGGFTALQNILNATGTPPGIVSISYGEAETFNGAALNAYINSLYQQAVTEGVSVFVSAGDTGAAVADDANPLPPGATHGIAVSGFTSTPYNVSVGGTDFADTYLNTSSTYWNSTNTATYGSAISYIPEIPWNYSCASQLLSSYHGDPPDGSGSFCNAGGDLDITAGSGGPSGCATGTPATGGVVSGTCAGYSKPSWQAVLGNPSDGVRDVPDVSLFAANGTWGHYYVICYTDPSGGGSSCAGAPNTWVGIGGTSVSSPIMAAAQALVNQSIGISNSGNPNPTYYSLAGTEYGASGSASCNSEAVGGPGASCVFNDITLGDMAVDCTGTNNCYSPSGTYGVLSTSNSSFQPAYGTNTGWDFATGIGTVNVANLANAWPRLVPNVVGDMQSAASAAIGAVGLTLGTVTQQSSATVAAGLVISEAPTAGTSVGGGTPVSLVVSTGVPATHFVVSAPAAATAGSGFSFTVTAEDQNNNTVTGYTGTVQFTSGDTKASLPSNSTLSSGVGTFTATLKTKGSETIVATDTVTAITGTSGSILVAQGPAASIAVVSGSGQTVVTNANFANALVVVVDDAFGNVESGATVTFAANAAANGASGTFAGGANTAITGANGQASSQTFAANGTAGSYTVTATVPGVAGSASFALTNTNPATISVMVQSPAGTSFSVDSTTYTSAQSFNWIPGSQHTISTTSPQSGGTGIQYAWSSWSDGGAISHTVSPGSATTYTASFSTQYLLTAAVAPSGSGSITASPLSTTGYYASGTLVQLTAAPGSGYVFGSWSGGLSGTTSPQTVTMSGPVSVTANFSSAGGGSSAFLTQYALNNPRQRNDFGGWVGMELTVGSAPLTVSSLGRVCVTGNSGTHLVKFVNASNGTDLAGGSVSVSMAGCTGGQFVYNSLSSPITLQAGASYYLASQEASGGDLWFDYGTVASTNVAAVNGSAWLNGTTWTPEGSASTSYVPANFQYTTSTGGTIPVTVQTSPAGASFSVDSTPYTSGQTFNWTPGSQHTIATTSPQSGSGVEYTWTGWSDGGAISHTVSPASGITYTANFSQASTGATNFLTGYALNNPRMRNDYGGWVGANLTVGSSPLTVSSLGRICVTGNSGTHVVKFVNASTGTDVGGGSVSVSMAGCTPGQFVYISLASAITLQAGGSYYLVSQEASGGDLWFDSGTVTSTNVATVTSSVWLNGATWTPYGPASTSYVPANFFYTISSGSTIAVTVETNPAGASFSVDSTSYTSAQTFNWTPGSQHTIATTSPQSGSGVEYTWTGWSDGGAISHTVSPASGITYTANFSQASTGATDFLTGYALNNPRMRNDYGGWVGANLTVGSSPLTVSSLGRICVTGNSGTHVVKFVNASTGTDVGGGSVSVSMAGCTPGQFVYISLASAITLQAGGSYYLVSQEASGGDLWFDSGTVTSTNVATVTSSVWLNGATWTPYGPASTSYVPANFFYTISSGSTIAVTVETNPAGASFSVDSTSYTSAQTFNWTSGSQHTIATTSPQSGSGVEYTWTGWSDGGAISHTVSPASGITYTANFSQASTGATNFLTGYALNNPRMRNDYGGWVGANLTVGSSPLTVSSLGRICVTGNSGTHVVKFVNASTGTDVGGGSVSVSMAGCTPGQFVYISLASAITLQAGGSYYLVSQEASGGDLWFDYGTVTSTNVATVTSSVWLNGATWTPYGPASTSYVPPNFLYTIN